MLIYCMYSSESLYWILKCIVLYYKFFIYSPCTYVHIILLVQMFQQGLCFACKYVKTNLPVHMLNNLVTKLYKLYICSTYVWFLVYICISVLQYFELFYFFLNLILIWSMYFLFVFIFCLHYLLYRISFILYIRSIFNFIYLMPGKAFLLHSGLSYF